MISWFKVKIIFCIWYVHVTSVLACSWCGHLWVFSNEPSEQPCEQPSELFLGSYIWTLECFFLVPSFLTAVFYAKHSDVLKHSNVLQHFEPYGGCLFIPFNNYLKHINERSFVLTNKMILSLKSKKILHASSSSLLVTDDYKYSYLSMK